MSTFTTRLLRRCVYVLQKFMCWLAFHSDAGQQLLSLASSISSSSSRTASPGRALLRQMTWCVLQAGSGPSQRASRRRETRPQKRIKQPQVVPPPLSSHHHSGISSDREGDEACLENHASPLRARQLSSLSVPQPRSSRRGSTTRSAPTLAGPCPRTSADLCTWLRESGCATTL